MGYKMLWRRDSEADINKMGYLRPRDVEAYTTRWVTRCFGAETLKLISTRLVIYTWHRDTDADTNKMGCIWQQLETTAQD